MRTVRRAFNLSRQLVAEHASAPLLKSYQLRRLRRLVEEAYEHTVAYRCIMQRSAVLPRDIVSLDDLRRLPVVDKDGLREFSEDERTNADRVRKYGAARIATSGSSGAPFEFLVDGVGDDWRKAQYLRPYVGNGRRPWHRVLRLTIVESREPSRKVRFGVFPETQVSCVAPLGEQVRAFRSVRPSIVQGYPSALRSLACELRHQQIDTSPVELVFCDSELLTPDTRSLLAEIFGAPVLDVFGAFETDNFAYQCRREDGYHVALDSVIAEVVRDGQPSATGSGDLVVTVLQNFATPFIRYNLKDVVSFRGTMCGCGRTFPLMDVVAGRRDDLVVLDGGGRRSPMSFLWRFDAFSRHLREYQVRQVAVNRFVVRVVPVGELTERAEREIREAILADFPAATVAVYPADALERTPAGKLKAFVCDVPDR